MVISLADTNQLPQSMFLLRLLQLVFQVSLVSVMSLEKSLLLLLLLQ
jgi:hypothetical protein